MNSKMTQKTYSCSLSFEVKAFDADKAKKLFLAQIRCDLEDDKVVVVEKTDE